MKQNKHFYCFFCSLVFLLILIGCHSSSKQTLTHFSQNVMTIDYHISVGDPLTSENRLKIQKLIDETFHEIDFIYNKWNPHSEVSLLNSLPAYTYHSLSPQLHHFFQRIDQFVHLSEGRFDPTIEPLQKLWKKRMEEGVCPSLEEIENIKPCIGWSKLHFSNGTFYKEHKDIQLDFGGIAKGLFVDLMLERLHQMGLHHLYIEWGGEIRTLGHHPSKRPWHVFISRLSNSDPSQALAHIDLIDRALATSGDYHQFWKVINGQEEKKVYCHIFNPLTLMPVEVKSGSIASASLLALDCVTADALAKVLMLFDSVEEAQNWMAKVQIQHPHCACWIAQRE